MNNILKLTPIIGGTIKNGIKLNHLQKMSFCVGQRPKFEKSINTLTLMGRMGGNPELRGNEKHPVVTFSLATNTSYKVESGDWAQRTDWHNIAIFKPGLRESATLYGAKGTRALIIGRLSYNDYVDKDGNNRTSTHVVAEDVTYFQDKKTIQNKTADEDIL